MSQKTFGAMVLRYADKDAKISFDNFIACAIKLKHMFGKYQPAHSSHEAIINYEQCTVNILLGSVMNLYIRYVLLLIVGINLFNIIYVLTLAEVCIMFDFHFQFFFQFCRITICFCY